MRACVLSQPGPIDTHPLTFTELPVPEPAEGEVLVRVSVCGICRTDLHVVEGELPERKRPIVPGHQIVGNVVGIGANVRAPSLGARVGIPWLHRTCGACRFCQSHRENLCDRPELSGYSVDGGFADYVKAPADFVYALPEGMPDVQAAPLLCAGIIGYRCLRMAGLDDPGRSWKGARLGLYGFGAAAHVAIQIARARGAEVYAFSRIPDASQELAKSLGAVWVGTSNERPPVPLDAAIVFAPAGELVIAGLEALDKGATLVLGGIHMSPIPSFPYALLYGERVVRSVTNNTREDGRDFLAEASKVGIRTEVTSFPLEQANEALAALKHGRYAGAGVLVVS